MFTKSLKIVTYLCTIIAGGTCETDNYFLFCFEEECRSRDKRGDNRNSKVNYSCAKYPPLELIRLSAL